MKELLSKLYRTEIKKDAEYFFLAGIVELFTLLRIPSLIEPDWYGDEGIYQVIGRALHGGRLLYKDIWDNKPPVLYIYYALVNGDLFGIRLLSLIFGALAILTFYVIAKQLFQKSVSRYLSTLCFAILFGLPFIEGNIANAENFMLFPILLALFFVIKISSKSKAFVPALAGFFLSIAALTKIVAVFDVAAFVTILFALRFFRKSFIDVKNQLLSKPLSFLLILQQELILVTAFIIPIIFTILFFIFKGAFSDYIKAAFSQNVGYVGYGNYFLFPQGFLILKLIVLFALVVLAIYFRKKLGVSGLIIYTWLFFSVFNAFFSGRPYTHYVLVVLPAACLLLGFIFEHRKIVFFNLAVLVFLVFLFLTNFHFYTKIVPYYTNYKDFVLGNKSVTSYQSFFDKVTPRDYAVARFIEMNTKKDESVFILSDSGQIYYLSNKLPPGRYIVAYHISFYKDAILETQDKLSKKTPKYIIATGNGKALVGNFTRNYSKKYLLEGVEVYERNF